MKTESRLMLPHIIFYCKSFTFESPTIIILTPNSLIPDLHIPRTSLHSSFSSTSTLKNRNSPGRKLSFPVAVNSSVSEASPPGFRWLPPPRRLLKFPIFGDPGFVECRSRVAGGS